LVPSSRSAFLPPGASETELAFALPDLGIIVLSSISSAIAIVSGARWSLPLSWFTAGAVVYATGYCVAWAALRDGSWLGVALMSPAAMLSTLAALDVSAGAVEIFRRAAPSKGARHILATLIQIAVFWLLLLYAIPMAIIYIERQLGFPQISFPGQMPVAVVLFFLFSSLGLASGLTMARNGDGTPLPFDAPNRLVVKGPYAYLRNPMVLAGLGQGAAVGLAFGSFAVLGYVVLGGLIWQFWVRPAEEADLLRLFGDDYSTYHDNVRCWISRLRPYKRGR
jgi:protein-S-isoprenylcysteine O-methyltransferase Ste14